LLKTVLKIIDREEAMRDSAQRAFVNIARRVQAIVHQQNKELREMEEDHGRNPEVFRQPPAHRPRHRTDRPPRRLHRGARRRPPRTSMARARTAVQRAARCDVTHPGYRRIELHNVVEVAVNGVSVEPLIHAVAELLDNATALLAAATKVHVTALEVQTGIAIEIEDGGVSLSDEARGKAEEMLGRPLSASTWTPSARTAARHGRRRPPLQDVQPAGLAQAVRVRRCPRRPRRAARHAHHR